MITLFEVNQGAAPHITVVGHSYGTDVVTEATQSGRKLVADDVILIGSPGVPVDKAYQISDNLVSSTSLNRSPPATVWASEAGQNPIANLGVLGTIPTLLSFLASPFAGNPQGNHGGYWQGIGLANMANIELGNDLAVVFVQPT